MATVEITKDEAIAAVRDWSWTKEVATCGHTGCEDHVGDGPRYIHVMSGFGMDIPLESVEAEILAAISVGWTDDPFAMGHELVAVTSDRNVHRYEATRPAGVLP